MLPRIAALLQRPNCFGGGWIVPADPGYNWSMEPVETIRARYRPKRIITLFVGESAPKSGAFFYYGNSLLSHHMKEAMAAAGLGGSDDFLAHFKSYGWYLDDLVLTPVNHLEKSRRDRKCREAQDSLAARIAEYRPQAIISFLLSIKVKVEAAAITAGSDVPRFAVPFPGNGQQTRFRKEMAKILPMLPREPV